MTSLPALIAATRPDGDGEFHALVPDNWLQGRTCYGGVSAALAVHAARQAHPDLPPLRSAQIAFVGPLAGAIALRPTLLRQGRNAAFVRVEIVGEAGLGLSATFVFMRERESVIVQEADPAPVAAPAPDDVVTGGLAEVAFTQNFRFRDHSPAEARPPRWLRWVRLDAREALHPEVELMAIGDALPPAALRLAPARVPLSSLTWQVDLLGAIPANESGWWLLHAAADQAGAGGSSQRMAIWDGAGRQVATQMQSVALFG
ncbi:acyl-CoA thioesterase [Sphingomonas metalli]|uniref:Acyl-CoA thioesterase n=1 Tax=Sphingomonas metalli TaxID=1779358 RepID=A0A916T773_9SPHN|nr:thioesterase family protein [Sphingomonas metalli]GGB32839.1 acyl-CoA thioesterase [Sphingomonas metalli]